MEEQNSQQENGQQDGNQEENLVEEGGVEESSLDLAQIKHVLETALLVTQEPMSLHDLKKLFDEKLDNNMAGGHFDKRLRRA